MTKKPFVLLLVIVLAGLCPLAAALMLATGRHSPPPLPPLTPLLSPTLFFGFTPVASPAPGTLIPPATVPILATRAAIETQYAGTAIALTPPPR